MSDYDSTSPPQPAQSQMSYARLHRLRRAADAASTQAERDQLLRLFTLGVLCSRIGFTPQEVARLSFARYRHLRDAVGPWAVETVADVLAALDLSVLPDGASDETLLAPFTIRQRKQLEFRRYLAQKEA